MVHLNDHGKKPWLYHCLNKHTYTYTYSHTHTCTKHAHNTYILPYNPYPSRNRIVACKRHIIFLIKCSQWGKIWVILLFLTIFLTILTIILPLMGKIDILFCHQSCLVVGLSLLRDVLYYFLSIEIFEFFFTPHFSLKYAYKLTEKFEK